MDLREAKTNDRTIGNLKKLFRLMLRLRYLLRCDSTINKVD